MLIRTIAIVGIAIVTLGLISGQEAPRHSFAPAPSSDRSYREGTRLDQQPVRLRIENERLVLQIGVETTLVQVLENLASQRIYRANRDDPEDNQWTISGVLTEFEGKNYILIEQAVRIRQ